MFKTEVLSHDKTSLEIKGPIRKEDTDRLVRTFDGLIESEYRHIRITLNHIANMDIELNETRTNMGGYTLRIGGVFDRDVTLTLPDGTRATFVPRFCGPITSKSGFRKEWPVIYEAPEGVNATLETQVECSLVAEFGLG